MRLASLKGLGISTDKPDTNARRAPPLFHRCCVLGGSCYNWNTYRHIQQLGIVGTCTPQYVQAIKCTHAVCTSCSRIFYAPLYGPFKVTILVVF